MAYSSRDYAEMHFVYGFCSGNALAAQREYHIRYPNRPVPSPQVFTRLHQRLVERGTVLKQASEVGQAPHDVYLDEVVLDSVHDNPGVSSRQIANEVGVSQWKVLKVLKDNDFNPYHFTSVQSLQPNDFAPRIQLCRWLLNSDIEQYHFFKNILWTDESTFTREGVFNSHNLHHWATDNPKVKRECSFQRRFKVNVWAGVVGNQLIGPHVFEGNLNGQVYLDFLQHDLPRLLEGLNPQQRHDLIYQQDGAPPHCTNDVKEWLFLNYPTWIGRGGTVAWPARSPDLSPMDFFVWGLMKSHVYSSPVQTEEELRNRIVAATAIVRQKLSFKVTVRAMRKRCRMCIRKQGGHFENEI